MVLLGWIFLKEKPGWVTIIGTLLAAAGVLLVVGKGNMGALISANFGKPGDILVLLSALNWAVFSIISRPLLKRYSAARFTFYTMLNGWLIISTQLQRRRWNELSPLHRTLEQHSILGALCSALGYLFYNDGRKPVRLAVVFSLHAANITTLVAAMLLSEKILPTTIVGGALILLGVWQVNRSSIKAPA